MKLFFKGYFSILAFPLVFFSCSHFDEIQKDIKESPSGEESHNSGQNCGYCHNKEGITEAPWWNISGTVYYPNGTPHSNAKIQLWEKQNRQGKLIKSLQSDSKGNFYTNQIINFNNGCYIVLSSGTDTLMIQTFNGGSCNACHGISTGKIILK